MLSDFLDVLLESIFLQEKSLVQVVSLEKELLVDLEDLTRQQRVLVPQFQEFVDIDTKLHVSGNVVVAGFLVELVEKHLHFLLKQKEVLLGESLEEDGEIRYVGVVFGSQLVLQFPGAMLNPMEKADDDPEEDFLGKTAFVDFVLRDSEEEPLE